MKILFRANSAKASDFMIRIAHAARLIAGIILLITIPVLLSFFTADDTFATTQNNQCSGGYYICGGECNGLDLHLDGNGNLYYDANCYNRCCPSTPSCTNQCVWGTTQCSLNGYITCADYNGDGCTEWGGGNSCGANQTCSGGSCITNPQPCNSFCSGSGDCASGYCYFGACRNASCPASGSCNCAPPPPPSCSTGSVCNLDFGINNTSNTIQGRIYKDTTGDGTCSANSPYTDASRANFPKLTLTHKPTGNTAFTITQPSSNQYSTYVDDSTPKNYNLSMTPPPQGYGVKGVRLGASGSFSQASLNSIDFTLNSANTQIDWCIGNVSPWFQTQSGDVRIRNGVSNTLPSGQSGSTDAINPSLFMSSFNSAQFGSGTPSSKGWVLNREYSDGNSASAASLGSTSYSFYLSRAKQSGATLIPLNCQGNDNNCNLNSLSSGIYIFDKPSVELNISKLSVAAGAHVIILVNGKVRISTSGGANPQIAVPVQSLLVLAAKGDITIDKSVGNTPDNATNTLEGYYTSEGSIVLESKRPNCAAQESDLRLIVGGALITNSLRPLARDGAGTVVFAGRTLCGANAATPILTVNNRLDFLTQLTDFYKVANRVWREVNP